MKKYLLIALTIICFSSSSHSQDMGYKSFDVGLEYKWEENSPSYNIQAAINAPIHHSLVVGVGFKTAYRFIKNSHNHEKGRGWGVALGYRYYFAAIPKRFYIGARADIWMMNMYHTANLATENTKVMILQPNIEAGHTFVVNDQFFFTLFIAAGQQITVSSPGDKFNYGNGFVPTAGFSAGWRF